MLMKASLRPSVKVLHQDLALTVSLNINLLLLPGCMNMYSHPISLQPAVICLYQIIAFDDIKDLLIKILSDPQGPQLMPRA